MACVITRTRFGYLAVAAGERGVRRVTLPHPDEEYVAWQVREGADGNSPPALEIARRVADKLKRYYDGKAVEFDEPLDLSGAPGFHRRVYAALRKVGRGETLSYAELARRVGAPKAARAVGQAMAHNPVCVLIPCHRVLRSDGSLGGFGGGMALKRKMLELEGAQ